MKTQNVLVAISLVLFATTAIAAPALEWDTGNWDQTNWDVATSQTPTPTPTRTATNSPTPTKTATNSPTVTNTATNTATQSPTPSATNTTVYTSTPMNTSSVTATPTATNTEVPTTTNTEQPTATNTEQPTATSTGLPTTTISPSPIVTVYISAKAGTGGTINPSGKISVAKGSDASFEINPILPVKYEINVVKVDGVSLGAITSYTFSDVEVKHKIQATFKVRSYNITVTNEQPDLGKLNFTGVKSLKYGKSLTIRATPLSKLMYAEISVDGNVVITSSLPSKTATYKLLVNGEHTISVNFY